MAKHTFTDFGVVGVIVLLSDLGGHGQSKPDIPDDRHADDVPGVVS
jgi:hypothetical protein